MMKLLILFFSLFWSLISWTQFTQNDMPNIGDKDFLFKVKGLIDPLDQVQGNNVVWDYSHLYTAVSTPCEIKVTKPEDASPSQVMYSQDYINHPDAYATTIEYISYGAKMTHYYFPNESGEYLQGFAYRGSLSPNIHGDLVTEFVDQQQQVFDFPFQYGDVINQPIKGNTGFDFYNEHVPSEGHSKVAIDGKGTLKLGPNAEFNDVLRHTIIDTININSSQYNVIYRKLYTYYNLSTSKFPLFLYTKIQFGKKNGFLEEVIAVFTSAHKTAGIKEDKLAQFKIFPNPANDMLHLEIPQLKTSAKGKIVDQLGKEVLTFKVHHKEESLDLRKLPKGIYFLEIVSNERTQRMKLIKN